MSYPRDLDEIPAHELERELARRAELRREGLCDYCRREPSTPPCKFPDRHTASMFRGLSAARGGPWNYEALQAAHDRLLTFVRAQRPGSCKMLSLGVGCTCPLCDANYLLAGALGAARGGAPAVPSEAALAAAGKSYWESQQAWERDRDPKGIAPMIRDAVRAAYAVDFGGLAPAPSGPYSIREDLPEYEVVNETENHLAFTSTSEAEATAVRDALNRVARLAVPGGYKTEYDPNADAESRANEP